MKVDLIISADHVKENIIKDKVVVVIDMLRATSVITTAFINGCRDVIPLLTVEEAFEKKELFKAGEFVLGGERKAIKIDGFDFSNSPLEYTENIIKNKTLIITTTNGTRTLTSCTSAKSVFIGCMLNASAVAEKLIDINEDIVIVNAGTNGQFSMDDYICAGLIIKEMMEKSSRIDLTDIAKASLKTYEDYPNIIDYIREARHYKVMIDLGLEKDIAYCIQKNITKIVPKYKNGYIRI